MSTPVGQREPNSFELSFMYFPINQTTTDSEKSMHKILKISNILGYIPGISIIVGIARIILGVRMTRFPKAIDLVKSFGAAQILKGAMEICSVFGPILLAIDLINTVRFRHMSQTA